jgi:hypothetical protein
MPDLNTQLREYFEATALPLEVEEVVGYEVRVPGGKKTPSKRWTAPAWAYGMATMIAVLVLILGLALLLPGGNENDVVEPTPTTVAPAPETMSDLVEVVEAGVAAFYSGDEERAVQLFELPDMTDDQIRGEASWQAAIGGRLTLSCEEQEMPGVVSCQAPYHNAITDASNYKDGGDTLRVVVEGGVIREFSFPEHSFLMEQVARFIAGVEGNQACEHEELLVLPHTGECASLILDNLDEWAAWYETNPEPTVSADMWPQSSLGEVQEAQERADAGDPDYTWQVDPQLTSDDSSARLTEGHQVELVDRFLREVLGWEAYQWNPWESGEGGDGALTDTRFIRCAPGRTNPLYPPGPEPKMGELCAPTVDDLRYESVSLDLAQLDRLGPEGIWVVNGWRQAAPFAQVDPVVVEARLTERLEEFLTARIAGQGAEMHVMVEPDLDVPLLYATTSGAPYERYEIERLDGPGWPDARMTFSVRLFADGGATVVEQEMRGSQTGELWLDGYTTVENGQPIQLSHTSFDGEVTVSAPSTWMMWWPGAAHVADVGVWWGSLWRTEDSFGSGERIEFTDPVAYDAWCGTNGGYPLLSEPASAAAIAQKVISDPNFETTAPVAARVGGLDAASIDVALIPGGRACGVGMIEISRWIHVLWEPGWRLRLYLVDLPEGMSVQTLAITVVAPEERFEEVIAETAPIIESIDFHPG